jgi:hypothetical protein
VLVKELQGLSETNDHFHLGPRPIGEVQVSGRRYREIDPSSDGDRDVRLWQIVLQTPKMACSDFPAKRATKRQSPIDVSSSALPK